MTGAAATLATTHSEANIQIQLAEADQSVAGQSSEMLCPPRAIMSYIGFNLYTRDMCTDCLHRYAFCC